MNIKIMIKSFLSKLPKKNIIIFESVPDLSDNTMAVFDEMLRRGINKRYRMIWACENTSINNIPSASNVRLIHRSKKILTYYIFRATIVISCNRFLLSSNPKTINFYLSHGNPLKNSNYYLIPNEYDYILASSEYMKRLRSEFYGYPKDKIIPLGFPRNDVFAFHPIDLHHYFATDFEKIIVWYPTVRQFSGNSTIKTGSKNALPVVWDCEKAAELNQYAQDNKVLIVLKPHFAQDVSYISKLDLSNIVFINDQFFKDNAISSYKLVGSCDALLTDFSSIYYDYTLCDKPIGLIWEDYDEYKQSPGFAIDVEYMMKGGVKIYDLEGLKSFIKDVADGIDRLQSERREIRDIANLSTDGRNSERVVDFIAEKANLQ